MVSQSGLEGKVAIVTGAAQGIGRAYARTLAAAGAAVVVADILTQEGQHTAKSIEDDGGRALFSYVDVRNMDSTEHMAKVAVEDFGGIDILVNNAAVLAGLSSVSLTALSLERWRRVMDVNVTGAWLGTRAVVPEMLKRGGGVIVNQSSIAAYGMHGGLADYATSKAAVIGLTKCMATELAPDNIRVNAICPGGVATETSLGNVDGDISRLEQSAKNNQLIPRLMRPDDIAGAMLFLVSDAANFMTGQTLVVDGGRVFLG